MGFLFSLRFSDRGEFAEFDFGTKMDQKKQLNAEEMNEWLAGEQRRSAYWDKRIQACMDCTSEVLSSQQIHEIKEYWSQWNENVNPAWAAWYTQANGHFDPCYIPSNIYFGRITRALNRRDYLKKPLLQDKNYLDMIFPEQKTPFVLARNVYGQFLTKDYLPTTLEEAAALCAGEEEFVLKPSLESKGGQNVIFVPTEGKSKKDIEQILRLAKYDYVLQRVVKQHPDLERLNHDSINTIRIASLLWKGEVIILGAVIRIGTKGVRVDNLVRSNGVTCAVLDNGTFDKRAYDRFGNGYTTLPDGFAFAGYKIPGYHNAVEMVKAIHPRVAHFKLIGWDIAITKDCEPVLIEANMSEPVPTFHQLSVGPFFGNGSLLREVLEFTYEQYPMYTMVL